MAGYLAFWVLLGVVFATQLYLSGRFFGADLTWRQALEWSLADWILWGVFSFPIGWLAIKVPFQKKILRQAITIHCAGSLLLGMGYVAARAWIGQFQRDWEGNPVGFGEAFIPLMIKTFPVNGLIYWVMVGAFQGWMYYQRFQIRALRAVDLEKRLNEARLLALQMQLNPHFLFNTLHAISSLMHVRVESAERMIILLSELLRHALEKTESSLVDLEEELEFLERYLEIGRIRFGDRLRVRKVIDENALVWRVPHLVLQPLVENSMAYGVERCSRTVTLEIEACFEGDRLRLWVRDDGPGVEEIENLEEGIGLSNVHARLQQLYGSKSSMEYGNGNSGGFVVGLLIPASSEIKAGANPG